MPKCASEQGLAIGAVLSAMCPTVAEVAAWAAPCKAWGVAASEPAATPLVGVPVLALFGGHDPFASPSVIHARLAELVPDAFVVDYVSGGHNVLGSDCPRSVRSPWLAGDVHEPPPIIPSCITAPIEFER